MEARPVTAGLFIFALFLCSVLSVFAVADPVANAYEDRLETLRELGAAGRLSFEEIDQLLTPNRKLKEVVVEEEADELLSQALDGQIDYLLDPDRAPLNQGSTDELLNNVQLVYNAFVGSYEDVGYLYYSQETRLKAAYALYLNALEGWTQPRVYDAEDSWGVMIVASTHYLLTDNDLSLCELDIGDYDADTVENVQIAFAQLVKAVNFVNLMYHLNTVSGTVDLSSYAGLDESEVSVTLRGARLTKAEIEAQLATGGLDFDEGTVTVSLAPNIFDYTTYPLADEDEVELYSTLFQVEMFRMCPMCCDLRTDVIGFSMRARDPDAYPDESYEFQQAGFFDMEIDSAGAADVIDIAFDLSEVDPLSGRRLQQANEVVWACATYNTGTGDWEANANCRVKEVTDTDVVCTCTSVMPYGATTLNPVEEQDVPIMMMVSLMEVDDTQCSQFSDCHSCFMNEQCGWCPSTGVCQSGNEEGPFTDSQCDDWSWTDCPCDLWDYEAGDTYPSPCESCVNPVDDYTDPDTGDSLPAWRQTKRNCGFCIEDGTCFEGNATSPLAASCNKPLFWVPEDGDCPMPVEPEIVSSQPRVTGFEDEPVSIPIQYALAEPATETIQLHHVVITITPVGEGRVNEEYSTSLGNGQYYATWANFTQEDFGVFGLPNIAYPNDETDFLAVDITAYTWEEPLNPYDEVDNGFASVSSRVEVEIEARADGPLITIPINPVYVDENTAAPIFNDNPFSLQDNDGSEKMVDVYIDEIDRDAVNQFSCESVNHCSYIDPSRLEFHIYEDGEGPTTADPDMSIVSDLSVTFVENLNGNITVRVTGSTQEVDTGHKSESYVDVLVVIRGVADTPILTVQDVSGDEDSEIVLPITQISRGTGDASEILTLEVSGLPDGATLGGSTFEITTDMSEADIEAAYDIEVIDNADPLLRVYILQEDDFGGLYVKSVLNSDENFAVNLKLIATEDDHWASSASVQDTISVSVKGVADAPQVTVSDVVSNEDEAFGVDATVTLSDLSETLTIGFGNVPQGSSFFTPSGSGLVLQSDGVWRLADNSDLDGMTITPPENFAEDFTLTLVATAKDGTKTETTRQPFLVDMIPVADGFSTVSQYDTLDTQFENGDEFVFPYRFSLLDRDGSEKMELRFAGVPSGGYVRASSAYTVNVARDDETDEWVVSVVDRQDSPTIYIQNAPYWGDDLEIVVTAIATESEDDELLPDETATQVFSKTVSVVAIANTVYMSAEDEADGVEDGLVSLAVTAYPLEDMDGSESVYVDYTVNSAPSGYQFLVNSVAQAPFGSTTNVYRVQQADLTAVQMSVPEHVSARFTVDVMATTIEDRESPDCGPCSVSSNSDTITVTFTPVADAPVVTFVNVATTDEDVAAALTVTITPADVDGSEEVTAVVTGLPTGAVMSAGSVNADTGAVSLDGADLATGTLTVTPPEHSSDPFTLTFAVTVTDVLVATGDQDATTPVDYTLDVTVNAVTDAPTVASSDSTTAEDVDVLILFGAALVDTDGSETLNIDVTVPAGSIVDEAGSALGTDLGGGVIRLTGDETSTAYFSPPEHESAVFTLAFSAFTEEASTGLTAAVAGSVDITVTPVPDTPSLSVNPATVDEASTFFLDVTSALTDVDGSEDLTVRVEGLDVTTVSTTDVPVTGSTTVAYADLAALSFSAMEHFSGTVDLTVTAIATESADGSFAEAEATLTVTVTAVATPMVVGTVGATVTVDEDTAFDPEIVTTYVDVDGSETMSLAISGLPDGAAVEATRPGGSSIEDIAVAAGVATLGEEFRRSDGSFDISITSPENADDDYTITVAATTFDGADSVVESADILVEVNAVADAPELSVPALDGDEGGDVSIALTLALADDDGSEELSLVLDSANEDVTLTHVADDATETDITGVAGVFTLTPAQVANMASLTMGLPLYDGDSFTVTFTATATETSNADSDDTQVSTTLFVTPVADVPVINSVTIAPTNEDEDVIVEVDAVLQDVDGSERLDITVNGQTQTGVSGATTFTITPIQHSSDDFDVTVTAIAVETSNDDSAEVSQVETAVLNPVTDPPTLVVDGDNVVSGNATEPIPLNIVVTLVDDDGSESLFDITFDGLPDDAAIQGATDLGSGSFSAPIADVDNLFLVLSNDYESLFDMTVSASSVEAEIGTPEYTSVTVSVVPISNVGAIDIVASGVTTSEDVAVNLDFTVTGTDPDNTEELQVELIFSPWEDVQVSGVALSGDTLVVKEFTDAGLSYDGSVITVTPAPDSDADISVTIVATSREDVDGNIVEGRQVAGFTIVVTPEADAAIVAVGATVDSDEDATVPLDIDVALSDTDGSETVTTTLTGVPVYYSSDRGTSVDNGDGTQTITISGAIAVGTNVVLTSNEDHRTDDFTVSVSVVTTESADGSQSASIDNDIVVTVHGIADAPSARPIDFYDITVSEDTETPLNFALSDSETMVAVDGFLTFYRVDANEDLTLQITDLPDGVTFNPALAVGDIIAEADIATVAIIPADDNGDDFTFTVTPVSTETDASPTVASATGPSVTVRVTAIPVADTPDLTVVDVTGDEDTAIAVNLTPTSNDADGSEELFVEFTNLPDGAFVRVGADDFTIEPIVVSAADLADTVLIPKQYSSKDFEVDVRAFATDGESTSYSATQTLEVTVLPVVSLPVTVTAVDVTAEEDDVIDIGMVLSLLDVEDGSEGARLSMSGLPDGFAMSTGSLTYTAVGGVITVPGELDQGDLATLSGMSLIPAEHWDGSLVMTISLAVTDSDEDDGAITDEATFTADSSVLIHPKADAPTLTGLATASGTEDGPAIELTVEATLLDVDDETMVITVAGVPDGASLVDDDDTDGVDPSGPDADGLWTVPEASLDEVRVVLAEDDSVDFTLTFIATATEADAPTADLQTASSEFEIAITVKAVADAPTINAPDVVVNELEDIPLSFEVISGDDSEDLVAVLTIATTLPEGSFRVLNDNGQKVRNSEGGYDLTTGDMAGTSGLKLQLSGASEYFGGDIVFTISSTSTEQDLPDSDAGKSATTTASFTATVTPVPQTPALSASFLQSTVYEANQVGATQISLSVTASTNDVDGSETLRAYIEGVPSDATLSRGTLDADSGIWTLESSEFGTFYLRPAQYYSGTITVTVTAETEESLNGATSTSAGQVLSVDVVALPSGVNLSVNSTLSANEDEEFAFPISVSLRDTDLESFAVFITLPAGCQLSLSGVVQSPCSDAFYCLTSNVYEISDSDDLTGVTILPPANSDNPLAIVTEAISRELGSDSSISSGTTQVTVTGIPDAVHLTVPNSLFGLEDEDILISTAEMNVITDDVDGSEMIVLTLVVDPPETVIFYGENEVEGGNVEFPSGSFQSQEFRIVQAPDSTADITIDVSAYSYEFSNDGVQSATVSDTITITIEAQLDAPILDASSSSGTEDMEAPLSVSAEVDCTGSSGECNEELYIIVVDAYGLGASFTTSDGTPIGVSVTLDSSATECLSGPCNTYEILVVDGTLPIVMQPPADFAGAVPLNIYAETRLGGSSSKTNLDLITVTLAAIADAPVLTPPAGNAVSGSEDSWIEITDLSAALSDLDGSESLTLTIFVDFAVPTLPAGSQLRYDSTVFSLNSNNEFVVTLPSSSSPTETTIPPAGSVLEFRAPTHYDGEVSLRALAETAESTSASTASSSYESFTITVTESTDAPVVTDVSVEGDEDEWINLGLASAITFVDTDGSESFHLEFVNIADYPGYDLRRDGGSWTITPGTTEFDAQPSEGVVPFDFDVKAPVNVHYADSAPMVLDIQVSTFDFDTGVELSSVSGEISVVVDAVPDEPTMSLEATIAGSEDTDIELAADIALTDTDGSETLYLVVENLPTDAVLKYNGAVLAEIGNTDTYAISDLSTPTDSTGLMVTPPPNYSGDIEFTIKARSQEWDGTKSNANNVLQTVTLEVEAIADAPGVICAGSDFNAGQTATLYATEGVNMEPDFNFQITNNDDEGDSSSEVIEIRIQILDAGASLVEGIAVRDVLFAPDDDGIYTITSDFTRVSAIISGNAVQTTGPHMLVTVSSTEPSNGDVAEVVGNVNVLLTSVANSAAVTMTNAVGDEDTTIPIVFSAVLGDATETVTIQLTGFTSFSTVTYTMGGTVYTDNSDAPSFVWSGAVGEDFNSVDYDLQVLPPRRSDENMELQLLVTTEDQGSASKTVSYVYRVTVNGVPNTPSLSVASPDPVDEDSTVGTALDITAALDPEEIDGSETLSVTIGSDSASSFRLVVGGSEGTDWTRSTTTNVYTLKTATARGDVTVFPNVAHSASPIVLNIAAVATESNGLKASTEVVTTVTVTPIADGPHVEAYTTVSGGLRDEGTSVAMEIDVTLVDADGSETITRVELTGTQTNSVSGSVSTLSFGCTGCASFTDGAVDAGDDSMWILTAPSTSGSSWSPSLSFVPPSMSDDLFAISVVAYTEESDGSEAPSSVEVVTIDYRAVAQAPTVAAPAAGASYVAAVSNDNARTSVFVDATLVDMDGSEAIRVNLLQLPSSEMTVNGNRVSSTSQYAVTSYLTSTGTAISGSLTLGFPLSLVGETVDFEVEVRAVEHTGSYAVTVRTISVEIPDNLRILSMNSTVSDTANFNEANFRAAIAAAAGVDVENVAITSAVLTADGSAYFVQYTVLTYDPEATYDIIVAAIEDGSVADDAGLAAGSVTLEQSSSDNPCPNNCRDADGAALGTCDYTTGVCSCFDSTVTSADCRYENQEFDSVADAENDAVVIVVPVFAGFFMLVLLGFVYYERKRKRYMVDPNPAGDFEMGGSFMEGEGSYYSQGGGPRLPSVNRDEYEINVDEYGHGYDDIDSRYSGSRGQLQPQYGMDFDAGARF